MKTDGMRVQHWIAGTAGQGTCTDIPPGDYTCKEEADFGTLERFLKWESGGFLLHVRSSAATFYFFLTCIGIVHFDWFSKASLALYVVSSYLHSELQHGSVIYLLKWVRMPVKTRCGSDPYVIDASCVLLLSCNRKMRERMDGRLLRQVVWPVQRGRFVIINNQYDLIIGLGFFQW